MGRSGVLTPFSGARRFRFHRRFAAALLIAALPIGGCAGIQDFSLKNVYFHDQTRLENARLALENFQSVSKDGEPWQSMIANLEVAVKTEAETLSKADGLFFEGRLLNLETTTWDMLRDCGVNSKCPTPTNTHGKFADATKKVRELTNQIDQLATLIKSDPNGEKEIKSSVSPEAEPSLLQLLDALKKIEDDAKKKIGDVTKRLNAALKKVDDVVAKAESAADAALGETTKAQQHLSRILDLLRKGLDLDLLQDKSLKSLIDQGWAAKIPQDLADSIKQFTGEDLTTVGNLLNFLKTDRAAIEEVRLSLLQDWRRALVATRTAKLNEFKARLEVEKDYLALLKRQIKIEKTLSQIPTGPPFDQDVLASLEGLQQMYNLGGLKGKQLTDTRALLFDGLSWLTYYAERIGYLAAQETKINHRRVVIEHRYSIERSRLAAQSREQLISRGLEGLVSFSEGGITAEDIAGVIRFIQTAVVSVIAVDVQ